VQTFVVGRKVSRAARCATKTYFEAAATICSSSGAGLGSTSCLPFRDIAAHFSVSDFHFRESISGSHRQRGLQLFPQVILFFSRQFFSISQK